MIRSGFFCLFAALASASASAAGQDEGRTVVKPRFVHGLLDAHWEYPNFLPDDLPDHKAMPFQLRERKWQRLYAEPVKQAMIERPDEAICFRISGEGYVAPRRPTNMRPADEQFIFVKVVELDQLKSEAECSSRLDRIER